MTDWLEAAKAKLAACQDDSCIIRGEIRKSFVQVDAPLLIAEVERLRAALENIRDLRCTVKEMGAHEWRDLTVISRNIARAALEGDNQ